LGTHTRRSILSVKSGSIAVDTGGFGTYAYAGWKAYLFVRRPDLGDIIVKRPVVFISSTAEDLKPTRYRDAARDAALAAGFHVEMQEYWAAEDNRPLNVCLEKVRSADVLVVIIAHRFGWVPPDQPGTDPGARKSITWLECDEALNCGKEVLAFLIDKDYEWPAELREEHDLMSAVQANRLTSELSQDIQWRVNRLKEFKAWLSGREIRLTFTNREDLRGRIEATLWQWRIKHGLIDKHSRRYAPEKYLRALREETSYIEIRGLQVQSGKAHRFPIDELYIPVTTTLPDESQPSPDNHRDEKAAQLHGQERRPIDLQGSLKHRTLVILGDPGAGKTTFLWRIASGLCNSRLGIESATTAETLGLPEKPFPMLIRISDLVTHIDKSWGQGQGEPTVRDSPAWLAHFLGTTSVQKDMRLDQDFFEGIIKDGPAAVFLDGLDETSTRQQRECVADLVAQAARHFENCRFVVTSRPPAFEGKAILPAFAQVWIDPLENEAIEGFLARWCRAIFTGSEGQASQHCDELLSAVRSRAEIRRMARNPVMLTALAVVHWHEKRLPEQRADLYESIITWLSRSREEREGRLPAAVCVNRLQELALAMQNHPEGRQVQVSRRWAAEQIAGEWTDETARKRIEAAETFLREEELDSGIVVARGDDIRFWHLTFQEFLAARAIAARPDDEQKTVLLPPSQPANVYLSSWREAVLLLSGVLHKQGHRKVDTFVSAVLDTVCNGGTLADQARCAGLLGAAVRDLAPVKYRPADPRYQQLLDRVIGIFDAERAKGIDIKVIIAAAEALGQAGDPRFVEDALDGNWVTIPAGEFLMGAQKNDPSKPNYDPEADSDEAPVHRVSLDAYRIGRYPVTVGEYLRFVEAEGYRNEGLWTQGGFGEWPTPGGWEEQLEHLTRPVVGVSCCEAAAYAAWKGCRLPTEAEWERAARGSEGRRYPWGDDKPDPSRLNDGESGIGCPTPVGVYTRGATPEGIADLAGNVWEWCTDWFGKYPKTGVKDPKGPSSGSGRVLRGGAWLADPGGCRAACRGGFDPLGRIVNIGFRVVSSGLGSSE
jgi:formylglycine-generating enzyme required for sulfatase activity